MFSGQRQIICTGPNSMQIFPSSPFVILPHFLSFQEQPSNPSIERTRSCQTLCSTNSLRNRSAGGVKLIGLAVGNAQNTLQRRQ